MTNEPPDPLIDEIRETRRRIWESFGCDPHRYGEYLRHLEATVYRDRMAPPPPPQAAADDSDAA